jgi:hypothetical protein
MSRNFRRFLVLVVLILITLTVKTLVAFRRFSNVKREFPTIQNGGSRASVIARIGKPNYYEGRCGVIHFPDKNCAHEYVYSHPFAPLIPQYYIVSFSSDGHIIEANRWDSP